MAYYQPTDATYRAPIHFDARVALDLVDASWAASGELVPDAGFEQHLHPPATAGLHVGLSGAGGRGISVPALGAEATASIGNGTSAGGGAGTELANWVDIDASLFDHSATGGRP
ncbi:hypothetical protein FVE85_7950 [Porphyridium purpureum]|uniref:Uncharacterized protein n=1 Tax=Porphyridium purpureum TaxID=35688 RepID=A0A5J4YP17_PORPP|nr:hypothetical protein FVE85_7950 [Porphyridium purpureum]|eukprot:POR5680..scf295_9